MATACDVTSQVLEGHLEAVLALAVGNGHLISGSYDTTVSAAGISAPQFLVSAPHRSPLSPGHPHSSESKLVASIACPSARKQHMLTAKLACRSASGRWTVCAACASARGTRMLCECLQSQTAGSSQGPMMGPSASGYDCARSVA
jgi:hypothetical protein